jgi:hypothetical protein
MPSYYLNEAMFTLPKRGFVDRTLHRLESPLSGDDPLGIEIRRIPLSPGKSLRELVDAEISNTKVNVNGFIIVDEADVALNGVPAIVLRTRLRAKDEAYSQRHAHVVFEGIWISIVVTGPLRERAACDETFDRIVQSIEWRTC